MAKFQNIQMGIWKQNEYVSVTTENIDDILKNMMLYSAH